MAVKRWSKWGLKTLKKSAVNTEGQDGASQSARGGESSVVTNNGNPCASNGSGASKNTMAKGTQAGVLHKMTTRVKVQNTPLNIEAPKWNA